MEYPEPKKSEENFSGEGDGDGSVRGKQQAELNGQGGRGEFDEKGGCGMQPPSRPVERIQEVSLTIR